MFVVENGKNGSVDIPTSIYWAVVTITTVGYGDISPVTPLGKFLSVILMLCGYSIIAVPTGIVTSEMRKKWPKLDFATDVEIVKMMKMQDIARLVVKNLWN